MMKKHEPMTEEQLAAIKARAEAATPGPWGIEHVERRIWAGSERVCFLFGQDRRQNENNGVFIAHAREDVPALLEEVERLRKRAERLRAGVKSLKSTRDFLVSNLADRIGEEKFDEMRRDALIKKLFDAGVCAGDPDCRQVGKKKRDYDSEESGCYSCWLLWSDAMARNECEKCEEDESA